MLTPWRSTRWKLGDERTACADALRERRMLDRVDAVETGRIDGDGLSPACKCAFVTRGIDPGREPAGHGKAGPGEPSGEFPGGGAPAWGGAARAHHGELRGVERRNRALYVECRGCITQLAQQWRILRIAGEHDVHTVRGEPREIGI